MGFYQTLSRYYDQLFPAGEKEMAFIRTLLNGCGTLLDTGCGTGNKTAALAEGRAAAGFDLDPAMIERANAAHASQTLRFFVLDMQSMAESLAPGSYDAVTCLGNTLAHLNEDGGVLRFLRDVRTILRRDGVFIGQIINYDRILAKKIDTLPLIETPDVRFVRRYDWREGRMRFVTAITDKHTGETFTNDIELRPITHAGINSALLDSGFGEVTYYGSYAGDPYAAGDSFHLIFRATVR